MNPKPSHSPSSKDIDQDSPVMLIVSPRQLQQLGIALGPAWLRDDRAAPAGRGYPTFVWNGGSAAADEVEAGLLSAKELAARMRVTVQAVYQREESSQFFSIIPPARKRGRLFPEFLLDPRLDASRLQQLIQLFKQHEEHGATMNDLMNFLQTARRELQGMTPLDSLLARAEGAPGESDLIVQLALEELARVLQ